jgi:anti-sigma-K factor RskA
VSPEAHTPWREAVALYALDALADEERARLEEHLAGCEACRRDLADRLGEVAALAEAAEPVAPPPEIRARLLERLPAGPARPPAAFPARRPARGWLALAAGLLVGVALGALVARTLLVEQARRAEARSLALEARRGEAEAELARLRGELVVARQALSLLRSREVVMLAGLPAAPEAGGQVFVDRREGRALFVARDLPALPPDRVYQLWRIVDGSPLPAGLLVPGAAGGGYLLVESVGEAPAETWAVTVEPAGGVPQPTGAMVLIS